MNLQHVFKQAVAALELSSPTPDLDAKILLLHVCQFSEIDLYTSARTLTPEEHRYYQELINKRARHIPIAYLVGRKEFWSLDFMVSEDTLVPRADTESLVEFILDQFSKEESRHILELGTGCGAIGLAIAHERPNWQVTVSDINPACIEVAKINADRLCIRNVEFIISNWFDNIPLQQFDAVISNPPYISGEEKALLSPSVSYEPSLALFATEDGLSELKKIITRANPYLSDKGMLALEHGFMQGMKVRKFLQSNRFYNITTHQDLSGKDRISAGQKGIFD